MSRRMSICLSIDGALREADERIRRRSRTTSYATDDNGRYLTWREFRALLLIERNKGREVLPMGEGCGDPCDHAAKGCAGFAYVEKDGKYGCPGYVIPDDATAPKVSRG